MNETAKFSAVQYKWNNLIPSSEGLYGCSCDCSQKAKKSRDHKLVCGDVWNMKARWNIWANMLIESGRGDHLINDHYPSGFMLFLLQHTHHRISSICTSDGSEELPCLNY